MQKFKEFVNEKLTLDDISKMKSNGKWVDAENIKEEDLQEGNILEIADSRYLAINPRNSANPINILQYYKKDSFIFIRENNLFGNIYSYIPLSEYSKNFPYHNASSKWDIIKINTRRKEYKNQEEVIKDLKNIDKF